MGKGDIKTRKGKISKGTYGVRRPKKSNQVKVVSKKRKKKKATKPAVVKSPSAKPPMAKTAVEKDAKPKPKGS